MTVACVIVTYNRLALLKEAVDGVLGQTRKPDLVVLVNNNSSDGTRQWLKDVAAVRPELIPVSLNQNSGGAGGFYLGVKKAWEMGADWVWVLDDDTVAEPQALLNLLEAGEKIHDKGVQIGFLASQVNWKDGSRCHQNIPGVSPKDWWDGCDEIPGCIKLMQSSFVSILISRQAIEAVGYPVKEFFIWYDDVEYTRRITSAGFKAYYIPQSRVVHLIPENNFSQYDHILPSDLWKWRYRARNEVAVERTGKHGVARALIVLGYIWVSMLRCRAPLSIQIPILMSGLKGLFFNYRKWIEYPR
jgi:GT2 family glycosyltransferase